MPVALSELPLRAARLTGFVEDVEKARTQPLLQAADLEQTSMAMAVDALLMQRGTQWSALLPLTAPPGTEIDAARIRAALNAAATDRFDVLTYDYDCGDDGTFEAVGQGDQKGAATAAGQFLAAEIQPTISGLRENLERTTRTLERSTDAARKALEACDTIALRWSLALKPSVS